MKNLLSQGSAPRVTANSNCRYEVEWVTEYACHRDYLESHTCKLTSQQHDISIDLTPLTLTRKSPQKHGVLQRVRNVCYICEG